MQDAPRDVDVLIVGSGPSGISCALHLLQRDPSFKDRIVVVDKAVHPREKLCGGAITFAGELVLLRLGIALEPRHFQVKEVRMQYEDLAFGFKGAPVARIVHRAEFDHWWMQQARDRGVEIREGEALTAVEERDDHVLVTTAHGQYRAQVLVAADGSKSTVRTLLNWDKHSKVARLIEVLTDEQPSERWEFQDQVAVIDFTDMPHGLQGYYWDFPSVVEGVPKMNRGVFDSRAAEARDKHDLKKSLRDQMQERDRNLDDYKMKGHPIRWFDPKGALSRPHVVLCGDAAGVDPLLGEGIAFALGYGDITAREVARAFRKQDFSFAGYKRRVMTSRITWQLAPRIWFARWAYKTTSRRGMRALFRFMKLAVPFTPFGSGRFSPQKSHLARIAKQRPVSDDQGAVEAKKAA